VTAVANAPIPNLPGKRLVSRIIDYRPDGGSVPHRFARVSENASGTEPARLLAVIVVDAADEQLTIPDRR